MSDEKNYLTILPRPQIDVTKINAIEVQISVTSVSQNNDRVEMNDIIVPIDCAEEVAQALLKIARGE